MLESLGCKFNGGQPDNYCVEKKALDLSRYGLMIYDF